MEFALALFNTKQSASGRPLVFSVKIWWPTLVPGLKSPAKGFVFQTSVMVATTGSETGLLTGTGSTSNANSSLALAWCCAMFQTEGMELELLRRVRCIDENQWTKIWNEITRFRKNELRSNEIEVIESCQRWRWAWEISFVADRGSCKELMGLIDWDNESKPNLGLEIQELSGD